MSMIITETAQKIGNTDSINLTQFKGFCKLIAPENSDLHFRTFGEGAAKKDKRLTRNITGRPSDVYEELKELNDAGAGVFMVINEGGQKSQDISKIRAVFADTDGAELEPLLALEPHMVIASSSGNYHVYWLVNDEFNLDSFTPIQKAIADKYGTDKAVSDLPRVMRVPGFKHNKNEPFNTRFINFAKGLPKYSEGEIISGLNLTFDSKSITPQMAGDFVLDNDLSTLKNEPFPFNKQNAEEFLSAAWAVYPDGLPDRKAFCEFALVCASLVVVEHWPEIEARKILDEIASKPAGADQSNNDTEWSNCIKSTSKRVANNELVAGHRSVFKKARVLSWKPMHEALPDWLEEMNSNYFVAPYASTVVVFSKATDGWVPLKTEAFKLLLANKAVETRTLAGTKKQPMADAWLKHSARRQYKGVGFWPATNAPEGMFNLWAGWAVVPTNGDVTPALNHIYEVICASDMSLYQWIIKWCAYCVQHPNEQGHTALVIVGGRGTGKTMFADWMKSIFGRYSMSVANGKLITGDFTGHLERCVLLVAEEAFWAGDKAAENSLKHIITGNTLTVHHKGFTPYDAPNHLHVIMTSNEDWVIPAGVDERRFCVCNVSDIYKRNTGYFSALAQWAETGGIAALLDYLLKIDLKGFDVRNPPDTSGLREQKLLSLDPATRWILHSLERGGFADTTWRIEVSAKNMVDDFCTQQNLTPHERRRAEVQLGTTLKKIFIGVSKVRKRLKNEKREIVYRLPNDSLHAARKAFEAFTGLEGYEWGES